MSATSFRPIPAQCFLACALACMAVAAYAADVKINVPLPPSPLPTAHGDVLVYELNARNLGAQCLRLTAVDARGGSGAALIEQTYQGDAVAANTTAYTREMARAVEPKVPAGEAPPVDVPAGGGVVVFFYLHLPPGQHAPTELTHTLAFAPCQGSGAAETVHYTLPVSDAAPVVVGFPFRGADWVAGDAVNPGGTHRRTLIPIRDKDGKPLPGQFHVPERYAIDWVMIDDKGRRAVGPVDRNASYLAFGKQVVAVADGTISRVRDGMPEQAPPNPPPGQSTETAAGNFVMEDIGNGHYAFYAHLQPGSLKVKDGERVRRGQVLALLGNTGNSTEPHLHFHVSNANDPLLSEGVPYVFDAFKDTGTANGMNERTGLFDDVSRHAGVAEHDVMPGNFSIVTPETKP